MALWVRSHVCLFLYYDVDSPLKELYNKMSSFSLDG